jgi:hypothetical protein
MLDRFEKERDDDDLYARKNFFIEVVAAIKKFSAHSH